MPQIIFRLLKPNDIVGNLIVWRLKEPWSHAVVIFGDTAYSSTFPVVQRLPITDSEVACPPRIGLDFPLDLTQHQYDSMLKWCEAQVGKPYDYYCIVGWFFFGLKPFQFSTKTYCFEFCWDALNSTEYKSKKSIANKEMIEELLMFHPFDLIKFDLRNKITSQTLIDQLLKKK